MAGYGFASISHSALNETVVLRLMQCYNNPSIGEQTMQLEVNDNWQTQARGDNDSEYQIYKTNAESLGWKVKTYDEWLNS